MESKCINCAYGRYPKIPPTTPFRADLVIVGEAPGTTELARKRPFVGQSGKLLQQVLASFKYNYEEAYVTNVMLCRPPQGKPIQKTCVENCVGRLMHELSQAQPKVILALGNVAMHAVTGNFALKITSEQGRAHKCPKFENTVVIPCLHPTKILRTPGDFKSFQKAISVAVDVLRTGQIRTVPEPKFAVIDTPQRLKAARDIIYDHPKVGADIETTGLNYMRDKIIDFGVCYEPGKVLIFPEAMVPKIVESDIFKAPTHFTWHGGFFDTAFWANLGAPARLDHDTMKQHYALNENPPHGLEFVSTLLLGTPTYKDVISPYVTKDEGYQKVPKDLLYPYLARDCDNTFRLDAYMLPQVEADEDLNWLYYNLLMPGTRFLQRVSLNGMYVDIKAMEELHVVLSQQIEEKTAHIQQLVEKFWDPEQYVKDTGAKSASVLFKPSSPKQLAWLLWDRMKIPPPGKSGRSTDKEILKKIIDVHPFIPAMLDLRSVIKMDGTYVKGYMARRHTDGKVHSRFSMTKTVTGRLSSADPNVQNIHNDKRIRNIFQAPPGRRMAIFDYKAAELRILAEETQDPYWIQVFSEKGRDPHDELGALLYGADVKMTKEQRLRAKAVNFGVPYGRTPFSIAFEHNMPFKEAASLVDLWFERSPIAGEYLYECDRKAARGETMTTPWHRKRRFGLVTSMNVEDLQHEARNFRIQSICSDCTLMAAMHLEEPLKEFDANIIDLVHDSLVLDIPDDMSQFDDICRLVVKVMMWVPQYYLKYKLPFLVEASVGYKWGEVEEYKLEGVC